MRGADGEPSVSVVACWSGPADEGERVLRPLREFGPPTADDVGLIPDRELQSMPDAGFPPGRLHYWKASFLADLPGEAIDTILRFSATAPSPYTEIGMRQITGAASRVAPAATAFAHRGRHYDFLILSQWDDPSDSPDNMRWTRELFDAMSPHFRGVCQQPRRGGQRPGPGRLRHQLQPPGRHQGRLRSGQRLPAQPEHPTRGRRGSVTGLHQPEIRPWVTTDRGCQPPCPSRPSCILLTFTGDMTGDGRLQRRKDLEAQLRSRLQANQETRPIPPPASR